LILQRKRLRESSPEKDTREKQVGSRGRVANQAKIENVNIQQWFCLTVAYEKGCTTKIPKWNQTKENKS